MNQNYNSMPPLVDEGYIERARKLGSAELCDGMKGLGIYRNGCMDSKIKPIDDQLKMIGTATTVETDNGDNLPIHIAIYQGKPGYVLCIDGKSFTENAYLGDLMGSAAKAIGFEGIVIDGLVRDKLGLKEMELPVFSNGYMQGTPAKKNPGKVNVPIKCGGIEVCPGDLIVGDYDGVTVVPRDRIEEVLLAAEAKLDYEEKRREKIAQYIKCKEEGKELPDLTPGWVKDMIKG